MCGLDDLNSLNGLSGLNDLDSLISLKNLLSFMFSSTMAPKWPILVSQWSSKTHYFIDFGTLSLEGYGGHSMRPKLNLKDKSQMSTPNEYPDNFKSNSTCIFLSVRTKLKKPLCPRTQCKLEAPSFFTVYNPIQAVWLRSGAHCAGY